MSTGLRNSTIEIFRKRNHGNNPLRLLALAKNGNDLNLIMLLTRGFFVGKNSDTNEGAPSHFLTVDLIYTPSLTEAMLLTTYMAEEVNQTTGKTRRYRVNTDALPQQDDWRYVFELHAAFNDQKAIV